MPTPRAQKSPRRAASPSQRRTVSPGNAPRARAQLPKAGKTKSKAPLSPPQSVVTLCIASIALLAGNCVVPLASKQLFSRVPAEYDQLWAVLHPVHGITVYSILLLVFWRDARPSLRAFNPLHALPVSVLFGIYNSMKASVGKSVSGTVQLLIDQLAPLGVMALCVGLRATIGGRGDNGGLWRRFSQFAAGKVYRRLHVLSALVLVSRSVAYAALEVASATRAQPAPAADDAGPANGVALAVCAAKLLPFCVGFMYVEFVLRVLYPELFPTVMWWWTCAFQIPTTLATSACSLSAFHSGVRCFWFGLDYVANGDLPPQACSRLTPLLNFVGAGGSSLVNIAIPLVARHGSSALVTLIRGASLPVVSLLLSCKVFGGENLDAKVGTGVLCATLEAALWAAADWRGAKVRGAEAPKKRF